MQVRKIGFQYSGKYFSLQMSSFALSCFSLLSLKDNTFVFFTCIGCTFGYSGLLESDIADSLGPLSLPRKYVTHLPLQFMFMVLRFYELSYTVCYGVPNNSSVGGVSNRFEDSILDTHFSTYLRATLSLHHQYCSSSL